MDFRSQGVAVNAVGLLYASVGFCLSVLGAVLNAFYRHNAPPLATRDLHRKGHLDPSLPRRNRAPCMEAEPALRSQSVVPNITLNQHLDNQTTTTTTTTTFLLISSSQSIADHGSTPPSQPSSNDIRGLIDVDGSRVGFRMSDLKPPWVKEKPRISRCRSSPQLSDQLLSPSSSQQKKPKVKKDKKGLDTMEEKPNKTLRKMSSSPSPGGEKTTMKALTGISRNAAKKRSGTLRTQPYEAPYFCAPPVPALPNKPLGADVKPMLKSRSMTFAV